MTMSVDALSVDAAVSSDLDDLPLCCFSQLGRGDNFSVGGGGGRCRTNS